MSIAHWMLRLDGKSKLCSSSRTELASCIISLILSATLGASILSARGSNDEAAIKGNKLLISEQQSSLVNGGTSWGLIKLDVDLHIEG